VGADVNELAPIKGFDCYNFLVAKLVYKIIAYSFEFKKDLITSCSCFCVDSFTS